MVKDNINTPRFWITFTFGVTFAYFIWLSWNKLTEWIGDSTIVWIITGIIVLIGIASGYFGLKHVFERFT